MEDSAIRRDYVLGLMESADACIARHDEAVDDPACRNGMLEEVSQLSKEIHRIAKEVRERETGNLAERMDGVIILAATARYSNDASDIHYLRQYVTAAAVVEPSNAVSVNDFLAAANIAHHMIDDEMDADVLGVSRDTYSPELCDGDILALADALAALCMHTRGDFKDVPAKGRKAVA